MKLAISNIAWAAEQDEAVYSLMQKYGFGGLEIAPTRIFPDAPYENIAEAKQWCKDLQEDYGFVVPSMQSIWFGRTEKVFGSNEERKALIEYTKKAIDFAAAIGCGNLVFGCPKNRVKPENADNAAAIEFFRQAGEYAAQKGTVVAMEANPTIYGTNYINRTPEAFALIDEVGSNGFKLNLDVGTMIYNQEAVSELAGKAEYINHVHISEPNLVLIEKRKLHQELADWLREVKYEDFVSVEIGRRDNLTDIENVLCYVKEVFG